MEKRAERRWQSVYEVTREAILGYCGAVGETDPRFTSVDAARAAGFADLVAPPMFAAVYALAAVNSLQHDPTSGIDPPRTVHGGQWFKWNRDAPVLAGDRITTLAAISNRRSKGGLELVELETISRRDDGVCVSRGRWTAIVRGTS
jgi:acyl dehydratase